MPGWQHDLIRDGLAVLDDILPKSARYPGMPPIGVASEFTWGWRLPRCPAASPPRRITDSAHCPTVVHRPPRLVRATTAPFIAPSRRAPSEHGRALRP